MAYFAELSEYAYFQPKTPGVRQTNVGWLEIGREFNRNQSPEFLLDAIWEYCKLSFEQTRGRHECEFCSSGMQRVSERNGEELLLGSAEIRVLSPSGEIYAAPNLIYHYMERHDYAPPEQFVEAVLKGPRPASRVYLETLAAAGLVPTPTFRPRRP